MNKSFTRKPRWRALARQALKTFPVVSRRVLVLWLVFAMAGSMVARATYLQLVHNDFLQEQGNERFLRVVEVPAHRGMILDRNGEPLAVSSPVDSIWAEPSELLRQRERWPSLAAALKLPLSELEEKLAGRDDSKFAYLRRHLAPNLAQQVLKLKIPGVHAKREYRRYYPDAEVTSHLLGFTDIDDAGQEGLEKAFDPQLRVFPAVSGLSKIAWLALSRMWKTSRRRSLASQLSSVLIADCNIWPIGRSRPPWLKIRPVPGPP